MESSDLHIPLHQPLAERVALETIFDQAQVFSQFEVLCQVLDAVPNAVSILNAQRQIVYVNAAFLDYVGVTSGDALMGARVGEALNCIQASVESTGCGTSDVCATCGALHAILQAQQGKKSVQECRITRAVNGELEAVDMRVWATPFAVDDDLFTIFAAVDIADEKRRNVLERIFFHDIRNTAGVIFGMAELMRNGIPETQGIEFGNLLFRAAHKLIDEINAQQQLLAAERGELTVSFRPLVSLEVLHNTLALYEKHTAAYERHLHIDLDADLFVLQSDEALLGRVIGNMVKNALEACQPGETVTLGCQQQENWARFWVHNPTVMPRNVQLQIFKRSFSTKGRNRGLGTYSMKLLSENYLRGSVSFTSDKKGGTVFTAVYPLTA
ncbi:MAG: ATP-binding protein [Chloroflexota bacterium]|nr:GHKL domain-containing protein [Anaerolineales bacterium]MCA9974534.1 GHKL domain-containing protein [Anaerolineales bacterium]MCB8968127.1 GHKL domain-containing protein [Ardenticatenaceae bacterium]